MSTKEDKTKTIRNESVQPLYAQIKEALKQRILEGDYVAHERLPSESELMKVYGVSRITVRQALRDLHTDGLVFSVQGKGTFVSRPKAVQDIQRLQGFGEAMTPQGYETSTRVIEVQETRAAPEVAEALNISRGNKVVELKRIRYLNREPISIDNSFFPLEIGEKLLGRDMTQDIFPLLENEFGIGLGHADLKIEAVSASEDVSKHLNIDSGASILRIQRLVFSKDGDPIDFEYLSYRGDAFQYQLRVDRQ
ncbi:GntR family transcriptional regulator [Sulfuriflexus sp.]|uniref:GntR family transcriptional regulator n=1 Tax=Sulfuriflexus sp. TaxID=2015443 RepID=UPI0028CC0497|nr:GntR family transcriptional regulator [Sulfuriflexus sp.]MDT8404519.1 GntR family transcriptional regulator [Sulfuriflexus sp.]